MKHFILESKNCKGIYKRGKPYTLVLGAGICYGIMPNWNELTYKVLQNVFDPKLSRSEFDRIANKLGWSLDSLLQAGLNYLVENGGSIEEFNDIIQNILYDSLLEKANKHGLKNELKQFISDPFRRSNRDILRLNDFFESEYKGTSLFQICEFLIEAYQIGYPPTAILTFNADVLLHSILTLMQLKLEYKNSGILHKTDFRYKAVHHIIESDGHKIPIYHIHGSIVPNIGKRDARHNLVFPESSYHNVSGSTFSWQQNVFQFYSQRTRMVFIGLSMSDPNLRRWLGYTNSNLNQDIFNMWGKVVNTTNHIWITPKTDEIVEMELKKLGLSHLGIKVGEIENWSRLKAALLNLIN